MSITEWAVWLMETLGGPGAGLAIAVENLFPPIPSEIILPLAGFTASRGELSLASALVWTTVGSVVGAIAMYVLAALLGRERLHRLVERLPLLKVSDVHRAERWFARHGSKAVFFGRFVPVVRSLISIPAGMERMPPTRFVALTALGSGIWNSGFVLAGYVLGENWTTVQTYAGLYTWAVVIVAVAAMAGFLVLRLRDRKTSNTP